jgi:hypothetical protein
MGLTKHANVRVKKYLSRRCLRPELSIAPYVKQVRQHKTCSIPKTLGTPSIQHEIFDDMTDKIPDLP